MQMGQPVLWADERSSTDLSISEVQDGDRRLMDVYLGVALMERVDASESNPLFKMLGGRLYNSEVKVKDLVRVFKKDRKTIQRWGETLKRSDFDEMLEVFVGDGREKLPPAALRYIRKRYLELRQAGERSYRKVIRQELVDFFDVSVSGERLRQIFRKLDGETGNMTGGDQGDGSRDDSCASGQDLSSDLSGSRNYSPRSPFDYPMPVSGLPVRYRPRLVHHAGMILFSSWIDSFLGGFALPSLPVAQWLGQILQGAVNIEQTREIDVTSLSLLVGPVLGSRQVQRRILHQHADLNCVREILGHNLALCTGHLSSRVFYFDPHTKEYTGELNILKGWCGGRHLSAKAMHLDFIHTSEGEPCFVHHFDNFYDVRERFFMVLELFDQLVDESARRERTWVFDRGLYGIDALQDILDRNDWFITWEKGYQRDGWDNTRDSLSFQLTRERNHATDLLTWHFRCQQSTWHKDSRVRRIIVRVTLPEGEESEMSVLCGNPHFGIEEAVIPIYRRWIQENDFGYLDRHYGTDQITSYRSQNYRELEEELNDRICLTKEYRQASRRLRKEKDKLGNLFVLQEELSDERFAMELQVENLSQKETHMQQTCAEKLSSPNINDGQLKRLDQNVDDLRELKKQRGKAEKRVTKIAKRLQETSGKILTAKDRVREAQKTVDEVLHDGSRLQALIADNYRRLDTRAKAVMDAIRISARNIFYQLVRVFRPIYANYRDDHAVLRLLAQAPGIIHRDDQGQIKIELWPQTQFPPAVSLRIETFLHEMNRRINEHFAGRNPPVFISLLTNPHLLARSTIEE